MDVSLFAKRGTKRQRADSDRNSLLRLVEGPTRTKTFCSTQWLFEVVSHHRSRLTFHHYDPPERRTEVKNEIASLLLEAFRYALSSGARGDDIVHFYLDCTGLDFRFAHNPAGRKILYLKHLMDPKVLDPVLETLANIIQSNKDVYVDQHTRLTLQTIRPPSKYRDHLDKIMEHG